MHLLGCQGQKKQTVDQFYTEVIQWEKPASREIGRVRFSLVARLAPQEEKEEPTAPLHGTAAWQVSGKFRRPAQAVVGELIVKPLTMKDV